MAKLTKKFGDIETVVQYQSNFNKDIKQDEMDIRQVSSISENTNNIVSIKGNVTKLTNRVTELEKKGNSEITQDRLYNVLNGLLTETEVSDIENISKATQGRGVEIARLIVELLRVAMSENLEVKSEMNLLVTSAQTM